MPPIHNISDTTWAFHPSSAPAHPTGWPATFSPNDNWITRQLPRPQGELSHVVSDAAVTSHVPTTTPSSSSNMALYTFAPGSSSVLNPNARAFDAAEFNVATSSMNTKSRAQTSEPTERGKCHGRDSSFKQSYQQTTLGGNPFPSTSTIGGSDLYTRPNMRPGQMDPNTGVSGHVQGHATPHHMPAASFGSITDMKHPVSVRSKNDSGHHHHGCHVKQATPDLSHTQPPQIRLRNLRSVNNRSLNYVKVHRVQVSSAGSSSGYRLHNTLRGVETDSDDTKQDRHEQFQVQSIALHSLAEGNARQLSMAIMGGITESPHEQYDPPKSPKPRPANASFTPVRFTSDKARLASLSIDEEQILLSKSYVPRWAYTYAPSVPPPDWFNLVLENNYWPTQAEGKKALPISDLCHMTGPSKNGVIKISDFPYATTKAEIIAFIGRNAKIATQPLGAPYFAIHIILERESGKTNECYIEIETPNDASWLVRQFRKRDHNSSGRMPKIGDRDVHVELSSQEALCDALFPRAKNVRWIGEIPIAIHDPNPYFEGKPVAGFQGFFSAEEQYHLTKWGDAPERNPFINRSPTRAYENLISILHKYPWFEHELITLAERRRVYDSTRALTKALMERLSSQDPEMHDPREPTPALLQELAVAALSCPGFSERQKYNLAQDLYRRGHSDMTLTNKHTQIPLSGTHQFSDVWPFTALSISPGADMQLVGFYGTLFNDATIARNPSLRDSRSEIHEQQPMGIFDVDFGSEEQALKLTLAEAARIEMAAIDQMLIDTLPDSHWPSGYDQDDFPPGSPPA